jgi:hypothetical protein
VVNGILWIGDPHLTSRRPGRRLDEDFTATVLDKLAFAFDYAHARSLQVVIGGDMFHGAREHSHELLARLNRLLAQYPAAFCLAGNHDMTDTTLTEDTALGVLKEGRLIEVLDTCEPVSLTGLCILHPVPSGFDAPYAVPPDELPSIVLTHGDYAFGSAYPGAKPLHEIAGACMWINGHMHGSEAPVRCGGTVCHNPGNITRMSVDTEGHVPRVWVWMPSFGSLLVPVALPYVRDGVFDLTGRSTPCAESVFSDSKFTEMLLSEKSTDMLRTEGGDVMGEEIAHLCDELGVSAAAKVYLQQLMTEIKK